MNENMIIFAGNVVRDIELRNTASGMAVANFSVASNRRWTNKAGEKQEEATFLDCVAWGKTGEIINQYFHKGSPIYVRGYLRNESWETKEGDKRSKLVLTVEAFQFVGGKQDRDAVGEVERAATQAPRMASAGKAKTQQPKDHIPIEDDSIPF